MPANDNVRGRSWLAPVIYLSNNFLSMAGIVIVTGATVFWLFLLPTTLAGQAGNPYMGILSFLAVPALFFLGLLLIPLGIWLRRRRTALSGSYPADFPPLNWQNRELRRLVVFVAAATFVNIVIARQLAYGAVGYMESVSFCGQTCHVMQPEFTAFQRAPHSHVECVNCHVGPGASGFVQSKISGIRQLVLLTTNRYSRPIPTPVHNLRGPRDTCEHCHSPQKVENDRIRVIAKYADDETNTLTQTVLLMKIGGGTSGGIHGAHLAPGVQIRYGHSDDARQTIPWVEFSGPGRKTVYATPDVKPDGLQMRVMNCVDCHNRPAHIFETPERAVDLAIHSGAIPAALPFAKKQSLEILKVDYASRAEAAQRIPAAFEAFYRERPAIYAAQQAQVKSAAQQVLDIYNGNVFPAMKVKWGTYPNNLGHTDFPGCYRCHDGTHTEPSGRTISQDCNACHNLLAMDEANPKVLEQLGLVEAKAPEKK